MFNWVSEDTVRQKALNGMTGCDKEGSEVLMKFQQGNLRIRMLAQDIFRVTFTYRDQYLNIPSFAVVSETGETDFSLEQNLEKVIIKTKALEISIAKKNGSMIVSDAAGKVISRDMDAGFSWSKDTIRCKKAMKNEDHFYGLGEKTGFLDKKGRKYLNWNTDESLHTPNKDPLYKTIPFLITFNENYAYGIFVDKTCKTWFDLGEESKEYFTFEVDDFEMDYYFIFGPEIKKVIQSYTELTGRMELPPLWALGYQQCRWGYYPEEMVKDLADTFRTKQIPCDVIYLDIDYMDEYRVFTWNENRFPNPEKLMEDLRAQGFRVVTIVDPGVKKDSEYDVYLEGVKKDLFCKTATGDVYHGKVWPGDAAYPDFTKEETRKWWGEKHQALIGKGISGIWNDMNEPSDFTGDDPFDRTKATVPNDIIMENDGHPRTFRRYHNAYGFNMCKATYEGFITLKPEERPFMVTRSAYAGIQRYSSVWTGDNHSWWEHLASSMPLHMNIGMSGVPFVGGDVGGFQENATPELFARWMQLGVFTPFLRAHTTIGSKPHEPWAFGEEVEAVCKKYIELRYQLLPYHYNEFYKASKTGLPIMKPLVLEYPGDENVHNLCDQFLYGESILVAPVYRPSTTKRCVYLPEGAWYNYWTNEKHEGGRYIIADASIDILPMYIKAGAVIPTIREMNYVGEKKANSLTLDIYTGNDGKYSLYEDDGVSYGYRDGKYSVTEIEQSSEAELLKLRIDPVVMGYETGRDSYILKIHGLGKKPVQINGTKVYTVVYDQGEDILKIELKDIKAEQVLRIQY